MELWVGPVVLARDGVDASGLPRPGGTLAQEEYELLGETFVFTPGFMSLLLSCKGNSWGTCWSGFWGFGGLGGVFGGSGDLREIEEQCLARYLEFGRPAFLAMTRVWYSGLAGHLEGMTGGQNLRPHFPPPYPVGNRGFS